MSQVQGELKRSLNFRKLPTELHMIHCARQRVGISYELTGRNLTEKSKNILTPKESVTDRLGSLVTERTARLR